MVRFLCCTVSVFSVATEAQICANNDQFDDSVSLDFHPPATTCGELLSQVTDMDFVPSATTCQETIIVREEVRDWESDVENATVWQNMDYSRFDLLDSLTSCCKDRKTSCNDYIPPICKNTDKFNSSAEVPGPYFSGTCATVVRDIAWDVQNVDLVTFSPSATTCRSEMRNAPDLQTALGPMAVCCEDSETVCSDFNAQICKNKDQFDGFMKSGVAMSDRMEDPEATCFHVSSAMDAFVPSKETCSEQITMPGLVCCDGTEPEEEEQASDGSWRGGCGGEYKDMCDRGDMSRMLVLEQLASCCTDGITACDPYTTTTTTGASSNAVEQVCFSAVLITAGLML